MEGQDNVGKRRAAMSASELQSRLSRWCLLEV